MKNMKTRFKGRLNLVKKDAHTKIITKVCAPEIFFKFIGIILD